MWSTETQLELVKAPQAVPVAAADQCNGVGGELRQYLLLHVRRQRRGRLVEEDQSRAVVEDAGEGQPLHLTRRQVVRPVEVQVEEKVVVQALENGLLQLEEAQNVHDAVHKLLVHEVVFLAVHLRVDDLLKGNK